MEKRNVYESCVDYLKELYKLGQLSVIGLMVGAKVTLT